MSPSPIQRLKPYFKTRPRTRSAAATTAPSHAAAAQPGGDLEARRELVARRYAELQSDLGGLTYEMAIRDHFRLDVLVRRAAELQAVDAELSSVEQALGIATPGPADACPSCGAPIAAGIQYCGRCGASVAGTAIASSPVSANAAPPPTGGAR